MEEQITAKEEEERPTGAGSRAHVRQRTNEQTTQSENTCVKERTRACVREHVRQQHEVLAEGREGEKFFFVFFLC